MYRPHLTRNLRSLFFLLILSAILGACGLLWWANHTGMPEAWRTLIEREVAKQGAYIEIGGLSYIPLRGVIASDVYVYSDAAHQHELSRLEQIILDFDKSKLTRGEFKLTKLQLKDARLSLPVNPKDPHTEVLELTGITASVFMPGNRQLEVSDAHGTIEGINVTLDAQMIGYKQDGNKPPNDQDEGKRRALIAHIIDELKLWKFDQKHPPIVRIHVEGDVNERSSIIATLTLEAHSVEKNHHELNEVSAEATMSGDLLTISSLHASDIKGLFDGHIDYNIAAREGRFDLSSSLEVPSLLKAWLSLPAIHDLQIQGKETLEAEGEFRLDENNSPHIRATGHVECKKVILKSMPFDAVETSFAWQDKKLFLSDLKITRQDGEAHGKFMIQWPHVKLALDTTLPVPVYKPFFIGQPLEHILNDFKARKGSVLNLNLEGGFDVSDPTSWEYKGGGSLQNYSYKDVPINHADCQFTLNHHELDFHDGTVIFNYEHYPLRNAFDGPKQGTAKVARIRYNAPIKMVEIEGVTGEFWAAPMVRLFDTPVADDLEVYKFHQPPLIKGTGVVDVTPGGRTSLDVTFSSDHAADYVFLGESLTFNGPRAKVQIRDQRVTINNLSLDSFGGPVDARIDYLGKGKLEGEVSWTKLSLADLTSTYGFQMKGNGNVTGRIRFNIAAGKIETMNGDGLMAMEHAELFSVPLFGPLSHLIGGALNNDHVGFQQAKNAFFTFVIKNGILSTDNFHTSTTSLNFVGDGSVNLKDRTLDMTMRMNARGLLGLITLPLRPFYGMFQFHGTGPLKDTQWDNVMFTSPSENLGKILVNPPKAKVISQ